MDKYEGVLKPTIVLGDEHAPISVDCAILSWILSQGLIDEETWYRGLCTPESKAYSTQAIMRIDVDTVS